MHTPVTIAGKGRMLSIARPLVMGIINATPDSFFNESRINVAAEAVAVAGRMIQAGASILDIGGASSRPGAKEISPEEEAARVVPVISAIKSAYPDCWISVDTFSAQVASAAVESGADIINDITAGLGDAEMMPAVAGAGVPYIIMHMQGKPQTMQQNPEYKDVLSEVFDYLKARISACRAAGIKDIIIDPGFGFGKTTAHNYALLRGLNVLNILGVPVLAGLSRKRLICEPLSISPAEALNGTTALNMAALINGAAILRVHDVQAATETVKLYRQLLDAGAKE